MKKSALAAFTLIELLVVITIIAILASFALPAYTAVQERAQQTKDLSNGKQIALALKQFATDNNGSFPSKSPGTDYAAAATLAAGGVSNDAFWWLFPTYLQSEDIFVVPGSKWCPSGADNRVDAAGAGARVQTLKGGENGFAYVSGLTDTSNPAFPVVADGFATGSVGTYSANKAQPGGVWAGKKAVVIFCDASGQIMKCNASYQVPRPTGSSSSHYFAGVSDGSWIDSTNNPVLNPEAAP